MTEGTYKVLNNLLKASFDLNAEADNFAYNLSAMQYNHMSDIMHHSYAHAFPVAFADKISDKMLELNVRPVRLALNEYTKDYTSLTELFEDNLKMITDYRTLVEETITAADMNADTSVKIFLEDFAINVVDKFVAQAIEWDKCAKQFSAIDLNVHFGQITTHIEIIN